MIPLVVGGVYFDKEYKMFYQVIAIAPEGILTTYPSKFYLDATLKTTASIRDNIKEENSANRIQAYLMLRKLNNKRLLFYSNTKELISNSMMIIPHKSYTSYDIQDTPVAGDKTVLLSGNRANLMRKSYQAEVVHPTAYMMNKPYHNGLEEFIINKSMDLSDYITLIHRNI